MGRRKWFNSGTIIGYLKTTLVEWFFLSKPGVIVLGLLGTIGAYILKVLEKFSWTEFYFVALGGIVLWLLIGNLLLLGRNQIRVREEGGRGAVSLVDTNMIRDWLTEWGYASRRAVSDKEVFAWESVDADDRRFRVYRPRNEDRFLFVGTTLRFNPTRWPSLASLTGPSSPLLHGLQVELLRLGLEHDAITGPLESISIRRRIPLEGLTEFELMKTYQFVRSGAVLLEKIVSKAVSSKELGESR